MRRRPARPPVATLEFAGFCFPPEAIVVAVRWCLRYGLSYRDVEELLAERGIVRGARVRVPVGGAGSPLLFIQAARLGRHPPGDRWFVDQTYLKVAGRWTSSCRAVDQVGQVIDVIAADRRGLAAARRLFTRALSHGCRPVSR